MKPTNSSQPATSFAIYFPWALSGVVTLLALIVWGSSLSWHLMGLSIYQIFPVLGLVAFSIMWSHYISAFLNRKFFGHRNLADYYRVTGYAVLALIILHPSLLIYQRFRDGYGLPPGSYKSYVAPGMAWLTLLGSACLFIFLAYELQRWYKDRSWWKYVGYAGDAAMFGILYHGLKLGTQLRVPWFQYVWWFYGITLLSLLMYKYFFAATKPIIKS